SGLSRLNFGISTFVDGRTPPCAAAATRPTSRRPPHTGPTASAAASAPSLRIPRAVRGSGWAITAGSSPSRLDARSRALRRAVGTTMLATNIAAHAPSSGVRAVARPSFRASFLRCAVGFSVFSPLTYLPAGQVYDRLDGGHDQRVYGLGQQRDRRTAE